MASPNALPAADLANALAHAHVQTAPGLVGWLPILPVAIPLLVAALMMVLRERTERHQPLALITILFLILVEARLLVEVWLHGPVTVVMGKWRPPFGIAFTADLTGTLFALSAAIAALAAALHADGNISTSGRRYGFYPLLMVLMAGVSGAFLTGDIFNLYVWFEVLLIASFGLLILGSEREQIDGALKYAVLNLLATTLFLMAIGYLYAIFGTLNMADIARKAETVRADAPMMTLACLFALAFAMKAAAFPVNFWLPAAYHTPYMTVAGLFAALLTKVGVYSLLRVLVMLLPFEYNGLTGLIAVVAAATMIFGALGGLAQSDSRRLMGFIVIAGIGNCLAGIAIGGVEGLSGAILYALHSILLMGGLYFVVGQAGRMAQSFDLARMGGLYRRAPVFSYLALALFFAASGLPPFSGFWPKAILVKAALDTGHGWLAAFLLLAGFLTTLTLARLYLLAFWRPEPSEDMSFTDKTAAAKASVPGPSVPGLAAGHNPSRMTMAAISLIAAFVLGFGLFPERIIDLAQTAALGLIDPHAYISSVFPAGAQP
ncbi:Na+/H+ antiporter subunit D [Allorhizobium sp. BGMRC 0089]|uniref:Na+/H+ antiporter subunit D n=1 Tax=Allorhizobium sonneratiae TaxID=2934936 RepID=UPI002033ACD3|nr:Na+/H+ antiporter subunit D [Allorhizobium sonneratiae]MCM2291872.1 Na+/H+ antiporter subunit D [Allorhizobium sonneratiae]